MKAAVPPELPIIQHTYDFILYAIPILNRWPRDHKHLLGDRIAEGLYDFLEGLVAARYAKDKADRLQLLNGNLDLLRYQFRLLKDLGLMDARRFGHIAERMQIIGGELGNWLKHQRGRAGDETTAAAHVNA